MSEVAGESVPFTTKLGKVMDATIKCKHLKMRFCRFIGKCFQHKHMKMRNFVTELLFVLTIWEDTSEAETDNAV